MEERFTPIGTGGAYRPAVAETHSGLVSAPPNVSKGGSVP